MSSAVARADESIKMVHIYRGGSRNFKKGGGGHKMYFYSTFAASLESRASPQKADEQGGGGGGESDTFFRPQSHMTSKTKTFFLRFQKGGTGRMCPPPPWIRHWYIYNTCSSGGSRGGRIGRGPPPPPFFSADFCFFGLFWPIFGRGIEEFGFPAPPFSQILDPPLCRRDRFVGSCGRRR